MLEKIKTFLKENGYNSKGIENQFKGLSFCAGTTNNTSGIVKIKGIKYYYYCIAPWSMCPNGKIEVEIA